MERVVHQGHDRTRQPTARHGAATKGHEDGEATKATACTRKEHKEFFVLFVDVRRTLCGESSQNDQPSEVTTVKSFLRASSEGGRVS